ncbi:hypothetical protein GCM10010238_55070 [Streptomyces griseoviridis]|uniref:Uncharacterized protein n=1 Tax=Streptomyces griseoviridis TaxID=45398 RepID=A0A918LK38_STRGD|nr:hypothetical protein GCM10010238_55070 [Streptomyces niveoruber]
MRWRRYMDLPERVAPRVRPVRDGPVVAYERGGVLPHRHRYAQRTSRCLARHPYPLEYVEADEPQVDHARLDRGDVDGVDAPGVSQPFGGGGHVGGFLPGGETQAEPQAGRGRADEAPAGRDGPDLSASGGLDRQDPQPGRCHGQAARLHDRAVRAEQPGRGYRQADRGPVDARVTGPGVGGPTAECGDGTTHIQERCQVGHQAVAPIAAGKVAGVTAAAR